MVYDGAHGDGVNGGVEPAQLSCMVALQRLDHQDSPTIS